MKFKFLILVFAIIPNLFGGSIAVKGLFNFNLHMKYETSENPNVPDQYQQTEQIPGIGQFFENGNFFGLEVAYRNKPQALDSYLQIGLGYSKHSIKSSFEEVNYVFGEEIEINKFELSFGMGRYLPAKENPIYLYGFLGPVLNIYEGDTKEYNFKYKFEYENTVSFMLGGGAEINIIPLTFGLNIQAKLDLANIERGNLKVYEDGDWILTAKPTGENRINDDIFTLSFGFTFLRKVGA